MILGARQQRERGFTLIELLVVIIIIAVLAAIAIPLFLGQREKALQTDCLTARAHADRAQVIYTFEHGAHTTDCADLLDEGLIDAIPVCPSGGTLAWVEFGSGYRLDCSAHGQLASSTPATPLGSTFQEITSGLMSLIEAFHQKKGSYPRSWGDYLWTDIGLNPDDWKDPVGGLQYKPVGDRIQVAPVEGHVIDIQLADGSTHTLTSRLNWSLIYDLKTGLWYYHTTDPENVADIDSMVVREQ
jgi:prepilin-type N-terminal cleavage/methylation domain-containing protein